MNRAPTRRRAVTTLVKTAVVSDGDCNDIRGDPFDTFVQRLLDLRDEVVAGDFSGLQLIAARFDPEGWKKPHKASDAAEWLARNIEA